MIASGIYIASWPSYWRGIGDNDETCSEKGAYVRTSKDLMSPGVSSLDDLSWNQPPLLHKQRKKKEIQSLKKIIVD
jgi:hypothetical protein